MTNVVDLDLIREIKQGAIFSECQDGDIWQLFHARYLIEGREHTITFWARDKHHAEDVLTIIKGSAEYVGPMLDDEDEE